VEPTLSELSLRPIPICRHCNRELVMEAVAKYGGRLSVVLRCPKHGTFDPMNKRAYRQALVGNKLQPTVGHRSPR